MLSIKKLYASVKKNKILNNFNLDVKEGELHVIMGPNGSGKSTLANVLSGKKGYEISGKIDYQGEDLFKLEISISILPHNAKNSD